MTPTHAETLRVFEPALGLFDQDQPETLGLPLVPSEQVIVYRANKSNGWTFSHIPNLGLYQDRLYLMWNNGQRDEDCEGQRILYCTSSDGLNWSEASVLLSPESIPGFQQTGLLSGGWGEVGGEWKAFVTAYEKTTVNPTTSLWAIGSKDGRQWSAPEWQVEGLFMETFKRVGKGDILLGQSTGKERFARFYYRDSEGSPWIQAPVEGEPLPGCWPEPSCYVRPDGSLVSTLRADRVARFLYAVESHDDGRSWRGGATEFPDSTARVSAGNLPDGTSYLIGNFANQAYQRKVLVIALSRDGRRFDRAFALLNNPPPLEYPGEAKMPGWQYPNSLVWGDHLYIAYSISKEHIGVLRCRIADLTAA